MAKLIAPPPSPPPPPPCNESTSNSNAQKLKESFDLLVSKQVDIRRFFRSVAGHLESTSQIGEHHPLSTKWNNLWETYKEIYQDSQENAADCASFLNNYAVILVPLSQSSGMSVDKKKLMIEKFVERIPIHLACAKKISKRFQKLGKQVDAFPVKVSSVLRGRAEAPNRFESLWTEIEEFCMKIWQDLRKLFMDIVDTFNAMLAGIRSIRVSGRGACIAIELNPYTPLTSKEPQLETFPASPARQIKDDCDHLSDALAVFEDAWRVVSLSCRELLVSVTTAKDLAPIPIASECYLKSAEATYLPLVECLRAYSSGRSPEF